MKVRFSKMQGAGNDFVVLDATRSALPPLDAARIRRLGDRRYGVGADQVLVVEPSDEAGVDFRYRIFNGADGGEVEHCGNGARCFVRYVVDHGLADDRPLRVRTVDRLLELRLEDDGQVRVDMGTPTFALDRVPFDPGGLVARPVGDGADGAVLWPVEVDGRVVELAVLSMGNPHAVCFVEGDVDTAPVSTLGPALERHPGFPRRVNVGFVQVLDRTRVRLRVWERGAGETLACGTGACAAVVAGIRLGRLDPRVVVEARGGTLTIDWPGVGANVAMTGPATPVFEGEIDL